MKQRILSMFLVAVMVFTSVDITAFAQEANRVELGTIIEDENVQEEGTTAPVEEVVEASEEPAVEATEVPKKETGEATEEPTGEVVEETEESTIDVGEAEEPTVEPTSEAIVEPVETSLLVNVDNESVKIIASGKDNDVSWSIDSDGLLTILGNGDTEAYYPRPWNKYSDYIKEA